MKHNTARNPLLLLSLLTLLAAPVRACIWDKDTLAHEAKGLPNVVDAITGRFERNPPLYYAMRLERVRGEITRTPDNLALYDDAGAACDRLGRDDEALGWMEKKRVVLARRNPKDDATKTQWYRYYANLGTFRTHRWLRAGHNPETLAQMKQARAEIAKALEINPDAHFGRERIQLWVMDWIIEKPVRDESDIGGPKRKATTLGDYLYTKAEDAKVNFDGLTALSGLIIVGDAWESIDLFEAMADESFTSNSRHGVNTLYYLAGLRALELLHQGRHSFHPDMDETRLQKDLERDKHGVADSNATVLEEQYQTLRAEADAYQEKRSAYLMARLQAGKHPDTDPDFWKDWKDTPPSLERTLAQEARVSLDDDAPASFFVRIAIGVGLMIPVAWIGQRLLRAYKRRRTRKVATTP